MRHLFSYLAALALFSVTLQAGSDARFISGVYEKGHNVTEPRARDSKFMKTKAAGFLVSAGQEAYYAEVIISEKLEKPYFMRVIFENPKDPKNPFIEEAEITDPPPYIPMQHGPVKGLKIGLDYTVEIRLYRKKGDLQPIDSLTQPIRSYIDTTGANTKIKRGLAQ